MPYTLYLAGPLTGHEWEFATGWRDYVADQLGNAYHCLSPLRFVPEGDDLIPHVSPDDPLANQRAIVGRDFNDILRSDLVVANVAGVTRASVGTACEITYAYAHRKPILLCLDDTDTNPNNHAFLKEMCAWRCLTVQEIPYLVRGIL